MSDATGRLLDLWLPPEGAGTPMGCLTTTFSFDPDFFEEQCTGRFLGLQTVRGEGDHIDEIGAVLEREERLKEVPVTVIADRGLNPDSRSLRWDLLAATCPAGVMHAKVSLLHWQNVIRIIVSSANMTKRAYRSSIEIAVALDLTDGCDVERSVADDLFAALNTIVAQTPKDVLGGGPRQRAEGTVRRARSAALRLELRDRPPRGGARIAVVMPTRQMDAVAGLMSVWNGAGPPTQAHVMSPFFDKGDYENGASRRLAEVLNRRRANVRFVVPVDQVDDQTLVRIPQAIADAFPPSVEREIVNVRQPDPKESRGLHAKLLLLERKDWVAALIGSSNFTTPGLWSSGAGNTEVGIAIGAPAGSAEARALSALALAGDPIDPAAEYEPREDPEEAEPSLPTGFVQAVLDLAPPPTLHLVLREDTLPAGWRIHYPDGRLLVDAAGWAALPATAPSSVPLDGTDLPRHLRVRWDGDDGGSAMPVNILDPGSLPLPDELRELPLDVLIRALADLRPLPEALVVQLRRAALRAARVDAGELDPLKRHAGTTGQLLHRTRELSRALDAQRDRLERIVVTEDAYRWRTHGPFGPVQLAQRLVDERADVALAGELEFVLAESALTLRNVDVAKATRLQPRLRKVCGRCIEEGVELLNEMRADTRDNSTASMAAYADAAFARALL